jgi:hydroxysqualene dehydroxylase
MSDVTGRRVVVVGGGLAGMACAAALETLRGRGIAVTLVESRHALGGRAGSFEDAEAEDGEGAGAALLDNCQHVLLGCCTNLIDLYKRLGVEGRITFHRRVHFLDAAGTQHDLWGINGLPAPLHLGPSMAMFSALTMAERWAVGRAMLAMLGMGKAGREKLEGVAFGDWLEQLGQPAPVVTKFYDPILISALNEESRAASAKYAIQVFQDAMLAHERGYLVGLPNCALGELYAKGPCADVRLSTRVEGVEWETQNAKLKTQNVRAVGVKLRGGEAMRAEAVVLATNHHAVQRWVPEELRAADGRFGGLEKLESVPILGAHLWFDRPVMKLPFAALITGPLQWLFRKDAEGRVLHGVISAAREWVNVPREEALGQFEKQVRGLFHVAREAKLERGVIVIEKRATFSPKPGVDALRPMQAPGAGIENLFLAGDYTQTGWPATMEGAVRGGYLAAEAVAQTFGIDARFVVPDLPVEWPAQMLGLR